jgi:CheY-like chemotaxis protein
MNIENGIITTKSAEIYYGSAPNIFPVQQDFKGVLVAEDGSTVQSFGVPDPRVQFGDGIVNTTNKPHIQSLVERRNSADSVIVFPFDPKAAEFRMYNSADGKLLTTVNLKPPIDLFFASYPNDPDNPAFYGLKAPSSGNQPMAASQNPFTRSTGQLGGILTIGSGAVLIPAGVFVSSWFTRTRPKCVLIVDDNPDIIEVISGMLKNGGFTTRTAISGEEGLKELEIAAPDIILLDIGMEPMDGWETLRRMKKNPATRGIPVIMLTALQLTPKDVENYGICIEDYVVKPVTLQNLKDAITHVFARQQMIREKIAAANGAGIDRKDLCECARLTRVVDVNKWLWDLLSRTYNLEERIKGPEDEITLAIQKAEKKIRDHERQLEQIQQTLGTSARG